MSVEQSLRLCTNSMYILIMFLGKTIITVVSWCTGTQRDYNYCTPLFTSFCLVVAYCWVYCISSCVPVHKEDRTHFTLSVPLSAQLYKGVPTNLMLGLTRASCDGLASHPGGVEILLFASCYRNRNKLQPDAVLGSYADFALPLAELKK